MNAVCPYCRTEIDTVADDGWMECSSCGTPHHRDCFTENGGCTVFGCAQAPADEPKISLTGQELVSTPLAMAESSGSAAPAAMIALSPPPPVLNTRDTTSVPPPPVPGYANTPRLHGLATDNSPRLTAAELYAGVEAHKDRVVYVLLGLFLGWLGAHSFYAGYYRRGAAQAALSVFSWWLFSQGYGSLISWIWAVVEICMITKDADGVQFS
jgi:TM2 domain-containing membrane protein YozV